MISIDELLHGSVVSYSQNMEDVIIQGFFEPDYKGFYVDVGANEPDHMSVTKPFYMSGWRGMNIEPIPRLHRLLKQKRPRDINVQLGISSKPGNLTLREYEGDGLSTFSENMKTGYESRGDPATAKYKDYKVDVKTLQQVFQEYKISTIDFMKVDVEGYEYEVLKGNDWKIYRPKLICIEANHIEGKDWHNLLSKNSYKLEFSDGLNEYFIDSSENADKRGMIDFSYVEGVINKAPVMYHAAQRIVSNAAKSWQQKMAKAESEMAVLKNEIAEKNKHITLLEKRLLEISTIRRHLLRSLYNRSKHYDSAIQNRLIKRSKDIGSITFKNDNPTNEERLDYDLRAYENHARDGADTISLKAYRRTRKIGVGVAQKTIRKLRKKSND